MPSSHEMGWLRVPLFLKILNSILLIIQSFFLIILVQKWYIFIFYLAIITVLAAVGALGLVRKNKRLLYVYGIYLSIYLCWACGMLLGMTLGIMWDWGSLQCSGDSSKTEPTMQSTTLTTPFSTTVATANDPPFSCGSNGVELAGYILGMLMDLITIVLSIIMIRLLYIMLKMMKRERSRSEPAVSYQTRLPGAPPLYTPTSPDSLPATPIPSPPPSLFDAGPLPSKEPESDRRPSLPPVYSPTDPTPPPTLADETPIL